MKSVKGKTEFMLNSPTDTVARPQGRVNSSGGIGCHKKRMPAAERQGEYITRWIEYILNAKACRRVAGEPTLKMRSKD